MDGVSVLPECPEVVLTGLTPPQQRAVSHGSGPLLVLAGPGSGKTRVITRRIAALIARGVPAWSILALTFTNKAAREMAERVDAIVPTDTPGRNGLTVSTFHSWCARLLRQYGSTSRAADHVNGALLAGFTILDTADARVSAKEAITAAGLDPRHFTPAWALGVISAEKNALRSAAECEAQAQDFVSRTAAKVYAAYEGILGRANALDFDDLLVRTARMLTRDASVRSAVQQRYRYLLVDEYQDTNHAQFVIARAVAESHANIAVVGDPDQSIYGWRGADISNILEFEEAWPGATIVALGDNFRSVEPIVACADHLIRHNMNRRERPLSSMVGAGDPVRRVECTDDKHEASRVIQSFLDARARGTPFSEMAVLYRMNALSRAMEEECLRRQVPYVIARGTAFYERAEVRTVLSYLRLLSNPADDLAFQRASQNPKRGIGDAALGLLSAAAAARGVGIRQVLPQARAIGLSARAANACQQFAEQMDSLSLRLSGPGWDADGACLLGQLVMDIIVATSLDAFVAKESADEEEAEERQANLAEVANAAADTVIPAAPEGSEDGADRTLLGALRAFLERVALVADADMVDPERGAVTLLTLHAAKGLEFDEVAIIGVEQGVLPHERANADPAQMEEERRLLYVGITRARKHLMICSAARRARFGAWLPTVPSIFDAELPEEQLHREGGAPRRRLGWRELDTSDIDARMDACDDAPIVADESCASDFGGLAEGGLVRHRQFGIGRVEALFAEGGRAKARVTFRTAGVRTLVLEYARLEPVR